MRKIVTYLLLFIFISLALSSSLNAQQATVKGRVVTNDDAPISVYVVKLEPVDTTQKPVVATFSEPAFEIPVELSKQVIVTISSLGYDDHIRQVNIANNQQVDLGEVALSVASIKLEGAVVTANRIQIERKGNNMLLKNIAATTLSDAGNFVDMLKRTPGVVVTGNDELTIIGYGSPAIYVNDREVKNKEELQVLRSSDVRSIEIVRSPSARYGASMASVIHIRTKDQLKDQLGVTVENYTNFNRKISNYSSVNLNVKKGILSGNTSYRYGRTDSKAYEYSRLAVTGSNSIIDNYSEGNFGSEGNAHNIFTGINLSLNPKNVLGAQYSGSLRDVDKYTNHEQQINIASIASNKLNHSDEKEKNNLHSVSVNYSLKRNDNSSLLFIGDYAGRRKTADKLMSETYLNYNNRASITNIDTESDFDVYTLFGQYTFKLLKDAKNSVGANFGHIKNYGKTEIDNQYTTNSVPQISRMKNSYFSLYYTFSKKWGKIGTDLGLRYEYDHNKVCESSEDEVVIKQEYSDLFPNALLEYSFTDDIKISANYRRRISRPSYFDLNPTINYKDSLNYITGNPSLKPTFYNDLTLSANIKKISFSFSYQHQKNTVIWVDMLESESSDIIISKPINIEKSRKLMLSAEYSYSNRWFNGSVFAQLSFPHLEYPYLNELKVKDDPYWSFSVNTSYTIYKTLQAYVNLSYRSQSDMNTSHWGSVVSLNAGISARFFKKQLYIAVAGSDITGGSSNNWWESYYGTSYAWQKNKYDMRGVRLTLRYTFNTIQSGFRNRSGNRDILYRL